jgi:hypothetical protein
VCRGISDGRNLSAADTFRVPDVGACGVEESPEVAGIRLRILAV